MLEDNTPTVTARRRKPNTQMRLRLEKARRLQGINAKSKEERKLKRLERELDAAHAADEDIWAKLDEFDAQEKTQPTIAPGVPKISKNTLSKPPKPVSKYAKRQRNKTWLPTHKFHTKRAHMTTAAEPLWRFAVPLTPTEKCYRPTHRANSTKGAIAWDMSYMATIGAEGVQASLEGMLKALKFGCEGGSTSTGLWGKKGEKWRNGTRSAEAWMTARDSGEPIAPVTVVWCAEEKKTQEPATDHSACKDKDGDETMEDATAQVPAVTASTTKKRKIPRRRLFVRVHPSAFHQLWQELLTAGKTQKPVVMLEDLRFDIGSIEITGPASTEVLIGSLQPNGIASSDSGSPDSVWKSLSNLTNPSALPSNSLLGFTISDPRLHFPPRKPQPSSSEKAMLDLAQICASWPPDKTQGPAALFSRPARLTASRLLPSQRAIQKRKSLAAPGKLPSPQPSDPRIPILLLSSWSPATPRVTNAGNTSLHRQGKWTLLLPWKCVLPVWYSMLYHPLTCGGNPRFGGIKEQRQIAFEGGVPWFPGDYPGTQAGEVWCMKENEARKKEWERRPPGRRVQWGKVDLGERKGEDGQGWSCDWAFLIKSVVEEGKEESVQIQDDAMELDSSTVDSSLQSKTPPTKVEKKSTSTSSPQPTPKPIYLPSHLSSILLSSTNLPPNIYRPYLKTPYIITIRLTMLDKGTPTDTARIYRFPKHNKALHEKWTQAYIATTRSLNHNKPKKQGSKDNNSAGSSEEHNTSTILTPDPYTATPSQRAALAASLLSTSSPSEAPNTYIACPPATDLIGFVTSGNYNLSEGKGSAVGCVSVSRVLESWIGDGEARFTKEGGGRKDATKREKEKDLEKRLCVVRNSGESVGRIAIWEVV